MANEIQNKPAVMDRDAIGRRTKQEQRKMTWRLMKQNKECYLMMLPFLAVFFLFVVCS